MTQTKATLISVIEAKALLKDQSDQINERFPRLKNKVSIFYLIIG